MNRIVALGLLAVPALLTACSPSETAGVPHTALTSARSTPSAGTTAPSRPTSTTASATQSTPANRATTLTIDDGNGDTADVTVADLRRGTPGQFATIKGTLYEATVTLVGVRGTFSVNPLFFAARSPAGDQFEVVLGATDDQLPAADVTPGQKLRGTIGFDVGAGQSISAILIQTPLGDQLGSWQLRAAAAPAPASSRAVTATDPAALVRKFYGDLNSKNFKAAWDEGGSNFANGGDYYSWVAGYADTTNVRGTATDAGGGVVRTRLTATHADGSTVVYQGTYTVRNGKIVAAALHRVR